MQVDFHYYAIAVLARAAGFPEEQALAIAYASQYVDDATEEAPFRVDGGWVVPVRTAHCSFKVNDPITQKYVYIPFHFIPGRHFEDGRLDYVVRPNSELANELLTFASEEKDDRLRLCRLGIALHTLADTWAHQQFTGWWSPQNDIESIRVHRGEKFRLLIASNIYLDYLPQVGHAEAGHLPDLPYLRFKYRRPSFNDEIERANYDQFMEAAEQIYRRLLNDCLPNTVQPIAWEDIGPRLRDAFTTIDAKDADQRSEQWQERFADLFSRPEVFSYDKLAWRGQALEPLQDAELEWDELHDNLHPTRVLKPRFRAKENFEISWWLLFHRAALYQQQYVLQQVTAQIPA